MASSPIDHAFSRRALFAGAGTVLTSFCVPLIAGERIPQPLSLLAPTVAYAEDATFEFDVAAPYLVGIKVVDVLGADRPGVQGATVTVTNTVNGAANKVTAVTDETGMATIDISSLCEEPQDEERTYECRASVQVRAEGCRPVDLSQVLLMGKTATALPTCSITKGNKNVPYFRSVTFDDYDIQYTSAAFLSASANTERHQIEAVANIRGASWARIGFWRWRGSGDTFPGFSDGALTKLGEYDVSISESHMRELEAADADDEKAAAEGRAFDKAAYEDRWLRTAKMDERFLQTNADHGLKPGDRLVMRIESSTGDAPYLMNVEFMAAPLTEAESGTYSCIPGLGSSGGVTIELPKSVPAVGGSKFKIWTPELPILYEISPLGSILLGFTIWAREVDTDKGYNPFVKDNWEKTEIKSCGKQWDKKKEKFKEARDDFKQLVKDQKDSNGKRTKWASTKMLTNFEVTAALQLFGELSYDWGESWTGAANLALGVAGEGGVSFQIALGPVPLYLGVDFSVDLTAAMRFGMVSNWSSEDLSVWEKIGKLFTNANISWNDNQVALVLNVAIGLSAGVGVMGVASVGVRGSAGMTNYVGLWDASWIGTSGSAKHFFWPHYRLGMGADLSVCAQVFIFKYSKKLCGVSAPDLYDSWKGLSTSALGDSEAELFATETGLPREFALNGAVAAAVGDNDEDLGIEPDENGGYTITLEEIAENGVAVSDEELKAASEFKTMSRAGAAGIGDDDEGEDLIEVTRIPASGEEGSIDLYAFDQGAYAGPGGRDDEADAAAAALADGEDDQDDGDDGADRPTNSEFDIEPEGDHFIGADAIGAAGVAGITEEGSLKPSVDAKILTGVYSDGRVRLVRISYPSGKTAEVLLRIAAGNYGGNMRTRLVAQVRWISNGMPSRWDRAWPIDFDTSGTGIARDRLYDYDFDVCTVDNDYILISLLSGRRKNGMDTDLLSAMTDPVTSVIICTVGSDCLYKELSYSWRSHDQGANLTESDDERYLTYMPRITATHVWPENERESYIYIAGTYLYKRASADTILSNDTPTKASGFILRWYASGDFLERRGMWTHRYDGIPGSVTGMHLAFEGSGYEASPRSEWVKFTVAYESTEGCGLYTLSYAHTEATWHEPSIKLIHRGMISGVKKFIPWNNAAWPLTAIDQDGVLCGVNTDTLALVPISAYDKSTDDNGNATVTPTIPGSFIFTDDGQLLIYAENKQGISGFSYDGVAQDGEPQAQYESGRYRVMACRAVKYGTGNATITLLSKPFALCDIDHAVDGITGAVVSGSSVTLLTQSITSLQESASDYYETRIPVIACMTATALAAPGRALFPGETVNLEATLKNMGNTQVGAAKLAIVDADTGDQVVAPVEVALNADTVVYSPDAKPSPDDPTAAPVFESGYHNEFRNAEGTPFDTALFGAHPLVVDGGRRALQPNREATVKLSMTVPDEWTGKKRLRVVVSDIRFANPASASAQAAWAGAAGITAECSDDTGARAGNGGVAGIAAIDEDVMSGVNEPFAEETTLEFAFSERTKGSLDDVMAPQLLKTGGKVDPVNPGESGGDGNNGGSGSSGNGKKGKSSADGLPDTGDPARFAGLGTLGTLAVMAGAGLAAYNRRRDEVAAEGDTTALPDETEKNE